MEEEKNRFYAKTMLHIAVILFGFTAIIGKLTDINALALIWWRMVIAISIFIIYFKFIKYNYLNITRKNILYLILIGFLIAVHWIGFYGSVKLSHVSVTLTCLSLTILFTSIFEPLILKSNFKPREIIISLLILPLMYWLIGGVKEFNMLGFLLGVMAAFFAALFSIYNKKYVASIKAELISFYEFIGVFIFMTPILIYYVMKDGYQVHSIFDWKNFFLIFVLAVLCTNFAFLISVNSLKRLSAFEANLIVGLEPVYGIILAYIFLHENEYLSFRFYIASILIFILIFIHPVIGQKNAVKHETKII